MRFFTSEHWQINEENGVNLKHFKTLDDVFLCRGELVVKDKYSEVVKFSSTSKSFYIKRYTASRRKFLSLFRASFISSEVRNLKRLKRIGLPVPKVVAYGERWKSSRFIAGALITEEVKHSIDLEQCLSNHPELLNDKAWLHEVVDQVAIYTRQMHSSGFVHRDLNLRNILVQVQGTPALHFIDCPSGGFRKSLFLKRGVIRDLALMERTARHLLSPRDLLRFYKKYNKSLKLTPNDKKLISRIRHFHDKYRAKKSRKKEKQQRAI